MLFFALLFIFTSAYSLTKGRLFYSLFLESASADIKRARGEIKEIPKEVAGKVIVTVAYLLFYVIAQYVFIIKALKIDPYLYPTLGIIAIVFLSFIFNTTTRKSKDLTTEEGRAKYLVSQSKRYSFSGLFNNLIRVIYFGYMFAVLLGLVK